MSNVMRRALSCAAYTILGSFPLFTPGASAQDDPNAIVVTATRFPEKALHAPIGMRVITAEDIAQSTANTLPEVLATLGGVHVRNNSGSRDPQLDLRGFGVNADQNTLVLLDGVRLNSSDQAATRLSTIPLQSIERIEVLPGGGGVAYGGGATGGTINIITKAPQSGQRDGSIFAGRGTHDTEEWRGFGSVATEDFGLTASATRYSSDNYRSNNDVKQSSGAAVLRWEGDTKAITLRAGADREDLRLPSYRTAQQLHTDRDGARTPDSHSDKDGSYVTLSTSAQMGSFQFEVDFNYRELQSDIHDVDPNPAIGTSALSSLTRYRSVAPRLRWQGAAFDMPVQWNIGADWYDNERNAEGSFDSIFGSFGSASDASERSHAIYSQLMAELLPGTRLNAGARVQRVKTEQRDLPPSFTIGAAEDTDTLYANELGLRQELPVGFSLFGRFTRSFRVANVDDNAAFNFTGGLLKPQRAKSIDVGLEYKRHGVAATLTAFHTRLENEIAFVSKLVIPPVGQNVNLSPTERRGIELAANASISPDFDLGGTLKYTKAEYRSGVYNGVDLSGNEIPLVPRWTATVQGSWRMAEKTRWSASYTYVGEQRYDDDQANTFSRMPSYEVVDLRLTHKWKDWLLAGTISNLFDAEYYSYGILAPAQCSSFCAYPQTERTFFMSAEYQF